MTSLLVAAVGCGADPEEALLGCWSETGWTYERADEGTAPKSRWNDGVRFRQYPDRQVVRHEAELWEFRPRGQLAIGDLDGTLDQARWRLKGRGHVLTIRHAENSFEVYDIKELSPQRLVLHFDMGMEVRGIARLEFSRTSCNAAMRAGRLKPSAEDLALAAEEARADEPGNAS
ncbi:MAG: hypothetical protein KF901_06685 [Myxococcales bacterium]|nr:hypothetical protein [Myxococcales bacterium]